MQVVKTESQYTGEKKAVIHWSKDDILFAIGLLKLHKPVRYTQLAKWIISKNKPDLENVMGTCAGIPQMMRTYLSEHPESDIIIVDKHQTLVVRDPECKSLLQKLNDTDHLFSCAPDGHAYEMAEYSQRCAKCPYVNLE